LAGVNVHHATNRGTTSWGEEEEEGHLLEDGHKKDDQQN
jgi:hypothetical protein